MTEKEKMISGKLYDPSDKELAQMRKKAHNLCIQYNSLFEDDERRKELLNMLIPNKGNGAFFQGPIQFDYGEFTEIGDNFYANFNLTILDCCKVKIGNNVMIGPNVSILTPVHPLRWQERNTRFRPDGSAYDYEYAKPIEIGDNCWIAGNVTICGGVKIGNGCVIGAGSVVTKDIPDNCLAVGNPCRAVREITESDKIDIPE